MDAQSRKSGFDLSKLLAILGGLVTLFSGIITLSAPLTSLARFSDVDWIVNVATYGLIVVVLGLVAVVASRHVSSLPWAVSIIIVGFLAYRFGTSYLYNLGPVLIMIGGIVSIVVRLA